MPKILFFLVSISVAGVPFLHAKEKSPLVVNLRVDQSSIPLCGLVTLHIEVKNVSKGAISVIGRPIDFDVDIAELNVSVNDSAYRVFHHMKSFGKTWRYLGYRKRYRKLLPGETLGGMVPIYYESTREQYVFNVPGIYRLFVKYQDPLLDRSYNSNTVKVKVISQEAKRDFLDFCLKEVPLFPKLVFMNAESPPQDLKPRIRTELKRVQQFRRPQTLSPHYRCLMDSLSANLAIAILSKKRRESGLAFKPGLAPKEKLFQRALVDFESVLSNRHSPDYIRARSLAWLAPLKAVLGNTREAMALCREVLKKYPYSEEREPCVNLLQMLIDRRAEE